MSIGDRTVFNSIFDSFGAHGTRKEGNPSIALLVQCLEGDKEQFLGKLHADITRHVGSKTPEYCLRLQTLRDGYTATWSFLPLSEAPAYAKRFAAYLSKKRYNEGQRTYEVDSILTGDIVDIVTKAFTEVITRHQEMITDVALAEISLHDETREMFLSVLMQGRAAHVISAKGQSIVGAALLHGVQQKLHHMSASIASNLGDKAASLLAAASKSVVVSNAAGLVTKTLATTTGTILLSKFSILIAKSIVPLLGKLLAMPVVYASLKKIAFAAVLGVIAKLIAAKLGMSIGFILGPLLIILIGGFLAKDIWDLPKKLGPALADAVCGDLKKNYTKTTTEIATGLIAGFMSHSAIETFAKALGDDPEVAAELGKLLAVLAQGAT